AIGRILPITEASLHICGRLCVRDDNAMGAHVQRPLDGAHFYSGHSYYSCSFRTAHGTDMADYIAKIQMAVLHVDADPIQPNLNCHFSHGWICRPDPQSVTGISGLQPAPQWILWRHQIFASSHEIHFSPNEKSVLKPRSSRRDVCRQSPQSIGTWSP